MYWNCSSIVAVMANASTASASDAPLISRSTRERAHVRRSVHKSIAMMMSGIASSAMSAIGRHVVSSGVRHPSASGRIAAMRAIARDDERGIEIGHDRNPVAGDTQAAA